MPSPPIPAASLSEPHVSLPHHFLSLYSQSNITILPPTEKSSSRSTDSLKTAWTEKVGNFVTRRKAHSNLTEENLEDFNQRNADLDDKRYSTSSPYYKGLTDFSLAIKGERLPGGSSPGKEIPTTIFLQYPTTTSPYYKGLTDFSLVLNREKPPPSPSSPGRESHAGSFSSSTSTTSFAARVQDFWGNSCFTFKTKEEKTTPRIEKVVYSAEGISTKEEPLRERKSEPIFEPPLVKTSPPPMLPPKSPPQPREMETKKRVALT